MANIGEQLQEARTRQGISLREAAEATKIRSDFLLDFENNEFDFDLPDVYKRGFLKLYARYLKLDSEKVITDFNAQMAGSHKLGDRKNREFFGRIDLTAEQKTLGSAEAEPPPSRDRQEEAEPPARGGNGPKVPRPADPVEKEKDQSYLLKMGAWFLVVFVLVAAVLLLINSLTGGPEPEFPDTAENEDPALVTPEPEPENAESADQARRFELRAEGDINRVIVRQQEDREILFDSPMAEGETRALTSVGPFTVTATDIQHVAIKLEDRPRAMRAPPGAEGAATLPFD